MMLRGVFPASSCTDVLDVGILCVVFRFGHFAQQIEQRDAFGFVQRAERFFGDGLGKGAHLGDELCAGLRQAHHDFATIGWISVKVDEVAVFQAVDDTANGGLIDHGGLDQAGDRGWAIVIERTHDDKLRDGEFRVRNELLKQRRVPLISPAQ